MSDERSDRGGPFPNGNGESPNGSAESDEEEVIKPPVQTGGPGGGRWSSVGVPTEKSKNFKASAQRLASHLLPEMGVAIVVAVLAIVSTSLSVVGPLVLGRATDVIFRGVVGRRGIDFGSLHRILLFALALYVASSVLSYVQSYLLAGMVQRTMRSLRAQIEDKLNHLPLRYIDSQPRGDLLSRVTNDIDNVAQSLQQSLSHMLSNVLMLVGTVAMMIVISPVLAIVALVTVPLSFLVMKQIAGRARGKFIAQWKHTGSLNAQVEEAFTGHTIVKAFGRQREVEERFGAKNQELYEASFGAQVMSGAIQPAMMFVGNLNFVAIAVLGAMRIASGAMSLGDLQAFIQYSRQFSQPLMQIASMMNLMQSGVASAERIFELLDAQEEVLEVSQLNGTQLNVAEPRTTPVRGRVEFDHVHFSYDPTQPLIEDLSLVAEPGQTIAIVGPTGAGKTTLVNLLMRFYELDGGAIRLDGRNISHMPRRELRSSLGMVLQDTWLFGGTIRDNIAYGNLDATDDQIMEAARATYVDRFVHSLPDGYDTVIDDEGSNVSAGEKQLLTIARAFLADPAILILDEATSSVDTRTEVLIQRAMGALRSRRTSFVIAHRLSTIRGADVILVMDGGRIVEQGNHTDLLASGEAYAALYNAQFAGAAAEVS